ncbi:MAG: hypothetical protein JNL49_14470 [Bacteroidia bacterium]|nr:hypothetical protein [Bacteroidia bacterium]
MARYKLIFIFFLMVIVGGCQAPVTKEEVANESDPTASSNVVVIDSAAWGMNATVSDSESGQKALQVQDTLIVKSKAFEVNKLQCYWEYTAQRLIRPSDQEHNLRIIQMQLKEAGKDRLLFAPENSPDLSSSFYGLTDLENNGDYVISCEDKNADSWCDYEILFERAAAGANTSTNVFLFDPKSGKFEYSQLFSGTNMEYDKDKNMIKTFWKMSVDDYVMTYTYLKADKKQIDYIIEEQYEADSVTVVKKRDGKIISRRKMANGE